MPKARYKLPGRLRKPGSKQRKRREARIAELIDPKFDRSRKRGIPFTIDAAKRLGFDLQSWLGERARSGSETEVLEIGCGFGFALDNLKNLVRGGYGGKIKTYGIDAMQQSAPHVKNMDKYIRGDALKVKFPQADFIFSFYALGYIGHPNVVVEKAAEALKPGGKAVLHFNSGGIDGEWLLDGAEKYFNKLSLQRTTRTRGTHVKVVHVNPREAPTPRRDIWGDWFVLVEKT